jgi:hypothetical protein
MLLAPALVLAACDDDEAAPTPTPPPATASPSPTPSPPADPAPTVSAVQEINFSDPNLIGPVIDEFGGGEVLPERVIYTDMTGDGVDEAVVIVESGGTMGDLGVAIFEVRDGRAGVMQFIHAGGRIDVRFADVGLGILVALEPVYAAGDPQCCPSQLQETVYQWDGEQFAVITEQVIDNPDV